MLRDASFLSDSANPTTVMGRYHLPQNRDCTHALDRSDADITHPPPGNCGRLSFTSLVGSIEANVVQHASRMEVQSTPRDVVEDLENMCVVRAYHHFSRPSASDDLANSSTYLNGTEKPWAYSLSTSCSIAVSSPPLFLHFRAS